MRIFQGIKSIYYVLIASVGLIVVLALVAKGALIGAALCGLAGYFLTPHIPINALAYRRRLVSMACFWLGALVSVGWIQFVGAGQKHALENAALLLVSLGVVIWLLFSFFSSSERSARTQAKAVFILVALVGLSFLSFGPHHWRVSADLIGYVVFVICGIAALFVMTRRGGHGGQE